VLGVEPADCVVIGDIAADVGAARAAGARGILVPTARTRPEEVLEAREVASDVLEAVELALGTPAAPGPEPVLSVPSDPRATVAA
jgi:beta-phosphoglucomutase-like phosphatase (HAD superfamily)